MAALNLAEAAEDALAHPPEYPSLVMLRRNDYVLTHGPNPAPEFGRAQRLRLPAEGVEGRIGDLRGWFAARERTLFTWWVGDHARPTDLRERLVNAGAELSDDPHLAAMVLDEGVSPAPPNVVVRPVQSFEDYGAQREISFETFGFSEEAKEAARARAAIAWEEYQANTGVELMVAFLDGKAVAAAGVMFCTNGVALLLGGSTLAEARGRGAYRALVRARWEYARRRGAKVVAVHAGKMSQPILSRLGFRTVGTIDVFLDRARAT